MYYIATLNPKPMWWRPSSALLLSWKRGKVNARSLRRSVSIALSSSRWHIMRLQSSFQRCASGILGFRSRGLRSRLREARLQGVHDRALISELLEAQHAQPTQPMPQTTLLGRDVACVGAPRCCKLEAFDASCQTDGEALSTLRS